ncbi:MAG TPA: hypothetical protein VLA05_00910, partial [Coriobacteriia bacterium]|nr:hypothetical protein [Coriobacteriia bacterium]
ILGGHLIVTIAQEEVAERVLSHEKSTSHAAPEIARSDKLGQARSDESNHPLTKPNPVQHDLSGSEPSLEEPRR